MMWARFAVVVSLLLVTGSMYYTAVDTRRTLVAPVCSWKFGGYTPSEWEAEWLAHVSEWQGDVCAHVDAAKADAWVESRNDNEGIFSRMEYVNSCTGERLVELIEPLVGLTRHPYFCSKGEAFLVDKSYMRVPYSIPRRLGNRHGAYFFDIGASLYDDGLGGASQKWFVEAYERRGVPWRGIWAWEVR